MRTTLLGVLLFSSVLCTANAAQQPASSTASPPATSTPVSTTSSPAAQASQSPPQSSPAPKTQAGNSPAGTDQLDSKTREIMDKAAKSGEPLVVSGAITDKADIEAVLLPYEVTHHVFGREVADHYAAVEITISNHNPDQSLIVQSILIDYSQWALSGSKFLEKAAPPQITSFQKANKPNQIASVEYRAVRGDALDAQPWTKRNVTIRALRLAGSIASAFSFVTRDQDIVHGITAFAGQGVPAAETFWPDGTVEQMNRISDLGFKVNKVIPKSASDVIVAFFPLKRFLTPGLNSMFKKSPALFFAPYALAFDHEARKRLRPIFVDFVGDKRADDFMKALPLVYMCSYESIVESEERSNSSAGKPFDPSQINALTTKCENTIRGMTGLTEEQQKVVPIVMKFLAHASLNTVRVVIGGDFTLNVNDIPAIVNDVKLDGAAAWSSSGAQTGTLAGSFLATGRPQIVGANLGVTVEALDNTADSTMKIKITLPKPPPPPGTVLTFRVDKTNDETKKTIEGQLYRFTVPAPPPSTTMDVTSASVKDNILSVLGTAFADTNEQPLSLVFSNPSKSDITVVKSDFKQQTPGEIDVDLCNVKGLSLDDSTWTVKVKEGNATSANSATFKAPAAAKSKCTGSGRGSGKQPQATVKQQGNGATNTTTIPPKPGESIKAKRKGAQ